MYVVAATIGINQVGMIGILPHRAEDKTEFVGTGDQYELALDFPNVDDGLRGMLFIDTVIESSGSDKMRI